MTIAQATGNARLACAIENLLEEMTRLMHLALGFRNRSQQMDQQRSSLIKALARGDGQGAERISREQIDASRNVLVSALLTRQSVMSVGAAEYR